MTGRVNIRELILGILLEINKEGQYSHIAIRGTLDKYQYLEKTERAFITRVCEGTQENQIRIDYIINYFSKVKVEKMKPLIRELLRSSVYQLIYMDNVPDSAVCNEAVKLARKKGFYNLTGFVNGVLRGIARDYKKIPFPGRENKVEYLSVTYSMPVWLVVRFMDQFGFENTEKMLQASMEERPVTVRIKEYLTDREQVIQSLKKEGVKVEKAPYADNAYYLSGYDYLPALTAFRMGNIQVQDVSSMLAGEAANPQKGSFVIDLCAAPGGKSLCVADKMRGTGMVDSRDVSEKKADLIRENVERMGMANISVSVHDATVFDGHQVQDHAGKAGGACGASAEDSGTGSLLCKTRRYTSVQHLHSMQGGESGKCALVYQGVPV